jgi:uncharacterized protein (DUF1800 family)
MMLKTCLLIASVTFFGLRASAQEDTSTRLPIMLPPAAMTMDGARHALDRLGFGPRPGEIQAVHDIGVNRWIALQFTPAAIPEPLALTKALAALPDTTRSDADLYRQEVALRKDKSDEGQEARKAFSKNVTQEVMTAHFDRALLSDRQLQEVLTNFWFNHFNVFLNKGFDHVWVGNYENEAIRPYVFGSFRTLLEATARHPAMLFYLDNWQNSAPGSAGAKGKEEGLNENYARELMELHTLGVDGGYTQHDVTELARILTGWGLRTRQERGPFKGDVRKPDFTFAFDPSRHDSGDKQFLGRTIKGQSGGTGWQEIEQALSILASHPATAKHLSFQLAQYFVADQPPPALVDRMAQTWTRTQGNLTEVMRTLVESPEFWAPEASGNKYKTPFEYVVSSLRAANVAPTDPQPLFGQLRQLGQPIYGIETPDGYKQVEAAWLNPDALARRLSFATALGTGHLGRDVISVDEAGVRNALGGKLSPQTVKALSTAEPRLRTALLLGSPDFMYR